MPINQTEELHTSTFNEASYRMFRIHKLQDEINLVRTNPLAFNFEKGVYNYEIWFKDTISLLGEVEAKLKSDERDQMIWLKDIIEVTIKTRPPITVKTKVSIANGTQKNFINKANWEVLEHLLHMFEVNTKRALDTHKMGTPDIEDTSGL